MEDRELDALVAEKAMGWTNCSAKAVFDYPVSGVGFGLGTPPEGWVGRHTDFSSRGEIPHFSTHMAPAFELMEKYGFVLLPFKQLGWVVCKDQQLESYNLKPRYLHAHYVAHADKAPRALCLAALKEMGVDVALEGNPKAEGK